MPYIAVNAGKKLSDAEKDAIKTAFGEKISIIPGKTEKALMVDIADDRAVYFRGEKVEAAYLDIRIYGTAAAEDKKAFTEAAFQVMEQAGFETKNVYVTCSEFPNWGVGGTMK